MDISHLNRSSSAAGAGPCSGPGTLTVGTACPGAGPASSAALTAAAPSSASREGHRRSPPRPRCFPLGLHPPRHHYCSRRRRYHPRHHLPEFGRARVNGVGRRRRPGASGAPSARPPRHSPRRAPPAAARSSCTSGASSSTTRSCSSLRAPRSPRSWAASPSTAGYGTRTVRVRPSRPRSSATRSRPRPGSGSVSAARSAITARRSCARPAGHVPAARVAPPRGDTPTTVTWGARDSASAVAPPGASLAPCFPPRFALLGLRVPAMEAAAPEGAEPGSGGSGAEEPVVSLAEVLAENEELEKEARAVLGGSDHERCSYSQGAVKRQALYACSTCTPPGAEPAGICLACSYECHGTHRLFELYTKRNFRCDCGNSKFKNLQCKLLPEKGKVNSGNKYNDNFYGLYCTCKRPYPDPEDEIPDEMIQCIVCEDWFHGRHLGAVPPESGDFHEMVCQACMKRCHFLWAYASQLAVPPLTKASSLEDEGIVLKVEESEEQKKEIKKESGVEHHDTKEEKQLEQFNEPSTSSGSACPEVVTKSEEPVCKLKELQSKPFVRKDTATFWPSNWRSKLCTCEDCLKMYSELEVQFLTDECDTVLAYENKGTSDQETERRDPLMDTLNSMNRVQQVELICEYNDLKTELTDYLRRFADEGTVVKREDIQHFFEEFQSRKRRRTNRMQYYCS